jgi:hypothetical protein
MGALLSKEPVCLVGTYQDAVLYAGATDYVFELDDGTRFSIRWEHGGHPLPGTAALLGTATDGPAEPTPARIGMAHIICFDAGGPKIKLAD